MALSLSVETTLPAMLPGVPFTPASPPASTPAALPAGTPALGLNYGTMRVDVYGSIKASTSTPGVNVQVL